MGDCRSPGYQSSMYYYHPTESQPYYHVTFVSNAAGALNEYGSAAAWHLYGCRLDGTDVRRLTFNLSSDCDPYLMWDGRLVYASWQRRTLEHGVTGRVAFWESISTAAICAPYVAGGKRIKQMPCATAGGLVVFVESDRLPWDGAGTLACVTIRRPLHSYRQITAEADGLFHSPSPLADGRILVSRRPADGTGTHARVLPRPDHQAAGAGLRRPPLPRRPGQGGRRPHGAGRPVQPGLAAGPARQALLPERIHDAVQGPDLDAAGLGEGARGSLEGVPRKGGGGLRRNGSCCTPGQLAQRRILGEVPIAPDGSFNVEVPANTPIELQLLDEQGIALRSCGWVWARNHFNQGCVGCHEDPELDAGEPVRGRRWRSPRPRSARRPRAAIGRFPPRRDADRGQEVPFVPRQGWQPAGPGWRPEQPATPRQAAGGYARWVYETLVAPDPASNEQSVRGKYVDPGRARTSPLVWHLFGPEHVPPVGRRLRPAGPAKPIPPAQSEPLSDEEKQVLVRVDRRGGPVGRRPSAGSVPRRADDRGTSRFSALRTDRRLVGDCPLTVAE